MPNPSQIASFDQAHAQANQAIDALIKAHREVLRADPSTREGNIAEIAEYLYRNSDHVSLAQILAVAVDRLESTTGPQGQSDG